MGGRRGQAGPPHAIKFGPKLGLDTSSLIGMLGFAALAFSLYHFARKPLDENEK